ncbi:unnamed protein product [Amoebophrya sp. A25]|nr:unnamed protein product [Amoebophrya sp. A25]|eukprot:GSA25T00001333001.1
MSCITLEEEFLLTAVRTAVEKQVQKDCWLPTDEMCLRYLRARQHSVEKATDAVLKHLAWLEQTRPLERISQADITVPLNSGSLCVLGVNRFGNPIWYATSYPWNPHQYSLDTCIKFVTYFMTRIEQTIQLAGASQFVFLCDVAYWALWHSRYLSYSTCMIRLLQDRFPERLKYAIILNAPRMFKAFYRIANSMVDKKTMAKCVFIDVPKQRLSASALRRSETPSKKKQLVGRERRTKSRNARTPGGGSAAEEATEDPRSKVGTGGASGSGDPGESASESSTKRRDPPGGGFVGKEQDSNGGVVGTKQSTSSSRDKASAPLPTRARPVISMSTRRSGSNCCFPPTRHSKVPTSDGAPSPLDIVDTTSTTDDAQNLLPEGAGQLVASSSEDTSSCSNKNVKTTRSWAAATRNASPPPLAVLSKGTSGTSSGADFVTPREFMMVTRSKTLVQENRTRSSNMSDVGVEIVEGGTTDEDVGNREGDRSGGGRKDLRRKDLALESQVDETTSNGDERRDYVKDLPGFFGVSLGSSPSSSSNQGEPSSSSRSINPRIYSYGLENVSPDRLDRFQAAFDVPAGSMGRIRSRETSKESRMTTMSPAASNCSYTQSQQGQARQGGPGRPSGGYGTGNTESAMEIFRREIPIEILPEYYGGLRKSDDVPVPNVPFQPNLGYKGPWKHRPG